MINSTNKTTSTPSVGGVPIARVKAPASRTDTNADRFSTESLDRLRESLAKEPAVRPDVVNLGRSLASDNSYPPPKVVKKLAELLVAQPDEVE